MNLQQDKYRKVKLHMPSSFGRPLSQGHIDHLALVLTYAPVPGKHADGLRPLACEKAKVCCHHRAFGLGQLPALVLHFGLAEFALQHLLRVFCFRSTPRRYFCRLAKSSSLKSGWRFGFGSSRGQVEVLPRFFQLILGGAANFQEEGLRKRSGKITFNTEYLPGQPEKTDTLPMPRDHLSIALGSIVSTPCLQLAGFLLSFSACFALVQRIVSNTELGNDAHGGVQRPHGGRVRLASPAVFALLKVAGVGGEVVLGQSGQEVHGGVHQALIQEVLHKSTVPLDVFPGVFSDSMLVWRPPST